MENDIIGLVLPWWNIFTSVVTVASGIAAATPTKKDDKIVGAIRKFIGIFALNIGNAKPKE